MIDTIDLTKEYEVKPDFEKLGECIQGDAYKKLSHFVDKGLTTYEFVKFMQTTQKMRLFQMSGAKTVPDVNKVYADAGYRPSDVFELVAFHTLFPETHSLSIVAFGTIKPFEQGADRFRPYIHPDSNGNPEADYGCFGFSELTPCCIDEKADRYLFLGTKIEEAEIK